MLKVRNDNMAETALRAASESENESRMIEKSKSLVVAFTYRVKTHKPNLFILVKVTWQGGALHGEAALCHIRSTCVDV